MSHRKELESAEDVLLNRTIEEEYTSELQKRNTGTSHGGEPTKSRTMKIGLLIAYSVVAVIGIILVIVALANRNSHNIENKQEYNMFKGTTSFQLTPLD